MGDVQKCDWNRMDSWSFNDALGDTVMEKYESLYVKLWSMFGESTYYISPDWVVCGKEVSLIFEITTSGFEPEPWPENVELFKLDFYKLGRINDKFDIYVDQKLTDTVYVGCDKSVKRLTIKDFFI